LLAEIDLSVLKLQDGFKVSVFARDLDSPRQMVEGSDGTIFVAERSGQIIALKDSDLNGQADTKLVLIEGLAESTGISIFDGDLYFSEISSIWKINDVESLAQAESSLPLIKTLITDQLPDDAWHGWKWLQHDADGGLYLNVGAPCNVCLSDNPKHASILRLHAGEWEYVAKGVRNSVGFDFHPDNKKLYFTDNGRDWMGDDSPSCELNRVDANGQFYGFPVKHASSIYDPEFGDQKTGYAFVDPVLELGAHVAPTGIGFYKGDMFPAQYQNNLFIALHGSWNRSSKVGYKVLRVIFDDKGEVVKSEDFISGWLQGEEVLGRPAAPLTLKDGSLLISDDKANLIYRITHS